MGRPHAPRARAYYRASRGVWIVRWRDQNGKSRQSGSFTNQLDAEAHAIEVTRIIQRGIPRPGTPRTIAFLGAEWWDRYVNTGKVQPATRTSYKTALRRIIETIGDRVADDVSTSDVVRWHEALNLSPRAANITLAALSSIYQRGIEYGLASQNPVRGVKRHRENTSLVQIPQHDQMMRLGITAPADRERGMLLVAVYSGVRQGELFALQVCDVVGNRLRVRAAVTERGELKPTKTFGERLIPLPPPVAEWLKTYITGRDSSEYLFPNEYTPGAPINRVTWRRNSWIPWTETAGVEGLLWRHLRHYYASILASAGARLHQASRFMGHSSITTTADRYSFLFDEDEDDVMGNLTRL